MDLNKYIEQKKQGLVILKKDEGKITATLASFNSDTGERGEDVTEDVVLENLKIDKANYLEEVAKIDEVLADIEALK